MFSVPSFSFIINFFGEARNFFRKTWEEREVCVQERNKSFSRIKMVNQWDMCSNEDSMLGGREPIINSLSSFSLPSSSSEQVSWVTIILCVAFPMTGHKNYFHSNPLSHYKHWGLCSLLRGMTLQYDLESMELFRFIWFLKWSSDTNRIELFKIVIYLKWNSYGTIFNTWDFVIHWNIFSILAVT